MDAPKFTLGLIQMAVAPDPKENLARAETRIEQAAGQGAKLVCLPELFRSRYFCQREDPACFDLAEPVPGPTTQALGKLARGLDVVIVAPVFERRAAGVYHNSAAVIDANGELRGLYRKMHIPDDPAYYEKFYFAPGDLGFRAFDTRVGRFGTLICWDQWYPEGARLTTLRGANLLLYPTAIGWDRREKQEHGAAQLDAWRTVQRAHAISNGVYVGVVNRVGYEESAGPADKTVKKPGAGSGRKHGIEFWGSSFVADAFGRVIAEASTESEEILLAEIDPERLENVRRHWPFLRDRRIDAYAGIDQRFLETENVKQAKRT